MRAPNRAERTISATNGRIDGMARAKVSVTLDPELLGAVDAYVESNPGQDRSKVIDQALQQWYARLQDSAMEDQFGRPEPSANSVEHTSWRAVRRAAAARRLKRS